MTDKCPCDSPEQCVNCLRAEVARLTRENLILRHHCPACLKRNWKVTSCEMATIETCLECGHVEID